MRSFVRLLSFIAALAAGQSLVASEPSTNAVSQGDSKQQVVSEGVGVDVESARKDACRNAVRQALGAIVDAKTIVENDRLITDNVVVSSDGYVEEFRPLKDGETRQPNGLWRVRILATVRTGKLETALRDVGVPASSVIVPDPPSLLGRVITASDRTENASALWHATARGYPASCFQAQALPLTESQLEPRDDFVKCAVRVRVSARPTDYEEFAKRAINAFESQPIIASGRWQTEPVPNMFNTNNLSRRDPRSIVESMFSGDFGSTLVASFDKQNESSLIQLGCPNRLFPNQAATDLPWYGPALDHWGRHQKALLHVAIASRGPAPCEMVWFLLDRSAKDSLPQQPTGSPRSVVCSVAFKNARNAVVANSDVLMNNLGGVAAEWFVNGKAHERIVYLPGWSSRCRKDAAAFGSECLFTVPVSVPAHAFEPGLRIECSLKNLSQPAVP